MQLQARLRAVLMIGLFVIWTHRFLERTLDFSQSLIPSLTFFKNCIYCCLYDAVTQKFTHLGINKVLSPLRNLGGLLTTPNFLDLGSDLSTKHFG